MEKKERYEWFNQFDNRVVDNNELAIIDVVKRLNQQDKDIKYLQRLNTEIIIQNKNIIKDSQIVEQENKQLKQTQKQLAI